MKYMRFCLILIGIVCASQIKGPYNDNKYEVNQIEFTPLHGAIIFKDVADIINELENSMNPEVNKQLFSASESNEDIEDLLTEFQHYLDKAHKEKINYIEKNKIKNKVPMLHHEKFSKLKQNDKKLFDHGFNYYYNTMRYPQTAFVESYNTFKSPYVKISVDKEPVITDNLVQTHNYKERSTDVLMENKDKAILEIFPKISQSNNAGITSSCHCKVNEILCNCGCKRCLLLFNSLPKTMNKYDNNKNISIETYPKAPKYLTQHNRGNLMDGKINIRLKIDVQVPKISEIESLHRNQNITFDTMPSKEMFSISNVPYPYLNSPIPTELLDYKKMCNICDSSTVHKTGTNKKKKSRVSNNNKKHTGKKVLSYHNVKLVPQIEHNKALEKAIDSNIVIDSNSSNFLNEIIPETILEANNTLNVKTTKNNNNITSTTQPVKNKSLTRNSTSEKIIKNVSNRNNDDTIESFKLENTIETDLVEQNTTADPLRSKREIPERNFETSAQLYTDITLATSKNKIPTENCTKEYKKFDKLEGDMELLYWPIDNKNETKVKSKNITALILDRETKKIKLNMSLDTIHSNRILALEQAIFGKVDWNDVDTVAPIFLSFVGKYIRGILTFCSQNICHSMKCVVKTCLHRICSPDNRFNHKGHCTGNNDTDTVAVMESITDLPSNIVFDIVDILQDKMLGNIFGKATLCIVSKCITFIASKKTFQKSKCIFKELSPTGHCLTMRNVKNI